MTGPQRKTGAASINVPTIKITIADQKPVKAREGISRMPSRAYSLAGPLILKQLGGLSLLRSKKRHFFVLDELGRRLVYYRDEGDFLNNKEPVGFLPLDKAAFASVEGNENAFLAHVGERQFELEADNRTSCEAWMEALANREMHELPKETPPRMRRSSSLDYEQMQLYNTHSNDIMKPNFRKLSANPSTGSNFALSVLEEKLQKLSEELAGETNSISPSMTEWVDNWIQKHNYTGNTRSDSLCTTSSEQNLSTHSPCSVFDDEQESSTPSEELVHLRMVNNQQKIRMHELKMENKALEEQNNILREKALVASTSTSRFLNTEVARLNKKCITLETQLTDAENKKNALEKQMQYTRKEYCFALMSAIRIPLHDNLDVMQVKLIGGDVHKKRVCALIEEARKEDPSLPTLQGIMSGNYVDVYGFRQHFTDEPLAVQYMATQLHMFYENNEDSVRAHKQKWRDYIANNETITLNPETRALCRGGVPNSMRPHVWRLLIAHQTNDLKEKYGRYYFKNLCSQPMDERNNDFSPANLKQINLDLLRTMPSNVHFMSANCRGVSQLQQVLRAFCLHSSSLGYCQGMNFLAATALLFMTPEDSFWFLIAITEKYFDPSYFDSNLTGAQADQEVLKELLEWKQPVLAAHLASLEVDLTTITLNWFIALFYDTVPFQTLLRMWDCFLLEGPKVLYRFALVILGHHEEEILLRTDTIGIMKVVKAAVKLCFDVDGLFQKAFCEMRGLPSRTQLRQKQLAYLQVLRERLSKREQIRNMLIKTPSVSGDEVTITDICPSEVEDNICYIVSGNQTRGLISKVTIHDKKSILEEIDVEFDCRVASLVAVETDLIFVGLISGYIVAVQIEGKEGDILWEMKLPDTPLRLRSLHHRLFASLANGTLTVLENVSGKSPANLEMYHVPLGAAPLNDAVPMGDTLWVTSGCKISVIDATSLSNISTVFVACSTAGGGTPFFEKILCSCKSEYGMFLTTAHSTLIQLWQDGTCKLLFDVAFDHRTRKPSLSDDEQTTNIISLCFVEGFLWVGTSDGYVIIYAVEHGVPDHQTNKFILRRYPPGRRLNPESSPGGKNLKAQLCYIPTAAEAEEEEQLSRNEYPMRKTSKVSINIDQDNKQYSVFLNENNNEEKRLANGQQQKLRRRSSTTANWMVNAKRNFQKGIGSDSVFLADSISGSKYCPRHSTGSSNQSMEYDSEIFEMYSDEGGRGSPAPETISTLERGRQVLALSPRKTWEYQPPKAWEKPTIRRKDLLFDEPMLIAVPEDNGEMTPKSEELTPPAPVETSVELTLTMKLKISDRPVRRIVACQTTNGPVVVSCSGCITDEEALLVWRKDKETSLWINDPVYGPSCKILPQKQVSVEKKSSK